MLPLLLAGGGERGNISSGKLPARRSGNVHPVSGDPLSSKARARPVGEGYERQHDRHLDQHANDSSQCGS